MSLVLTVALTVLTLSGIPGTRSAWVDTSTVSGAAFSARTITPAQEISCSGGVLTRTVTLAWKYPEEAARFLVTVTKIDGEDPRVLASFELPGDARRHSFGDAVVPDATIRDRYAFLWSFYNYRVDISAVHASGWIAVAASRVQERRNATNHC